MGAMTIIYAGACALALMGGAVAERHKPHDKAPAQLDQLESARLLQLQQRAEFAADGANPFKFNFAAEGAVTDNEAALQFRITRGAVPFLSTLAPKGLSQFVTILKPCGILLPHTHQRSNEFYSVVFGTMSAGIAQENGGDQDIVFDVNPGEVFVVPQGLLHFNHNQQCTPQVWFQSFDSNDPGALNVIGALAALGDGSKAGEAAIKASNADGVIASPQGAFALDQHCLRRCHFPKTGAPGGGLDDLPDSIRALVGM